MANRLDAVSVITSNYVTARDNFRARFQARATGLIALSEGGPFAFAELVNGHAADLARNLPDLTLAQWEGLSELVNARLNIMRMQEAKK